MNRILTPLEYCECLVQNWRLKSYPFSLSWLDDQPAQDRPAQVHHVLLRTCSIHSRCDLQVLSIKGQFSSPKSHTASSQLEIQNCFARITRIQFSKKSCVLNSVSCFLASSWSSSSRQAMVTYLQKFRGMKAPMAYTEHQALTWKRTTKWSDQFLLWLRRLSHRRRRRRCHRHRARRPRVE